MTFSQVTIKFLVDFQEDYILRLTTTDGTSNTVHSWTWVNTRSAPFEVTEGSFTINLGETSSINFESAFDLDYPTGYVTTHQNINEVLIQSETEGEDFIGILLIGENGQIGAKGVDFDVIFENFEEPIDISNV